MNENIVAPQTVFTNCVTSSTGIGMSCFLNFNYEDVYIHMILTPSL